MFDSLKDVRQKFEKTICYYDGKAVSIQQIAENGDDFIMVLGFAPNPKGDKGKHILLSDPKFTYRNFNLGYIHIDGIHCPWLYRMPYRQYKQGLHLSSQVCSTLYAGELASSIHFGRPLADTLENIYPDLEKCFKDVMDNPGIKKAPHKDFALYYNRLHGDYAIEYRGTEVGVVKKNREFELLPEMQHLQEVFREEVLKC